MATATKLTEFDDIIQVVLKHEGGYVDDPDDRGGATNWDSLPNLSYMKKSEFYTKLSLDF